MHAALRSVGLSEIEASTVWGFLAALLLAGNMAFGDGATAVLQVRVACDRQVTALRELRAADV